MWRRGNAKDGDWWVGREEDEADTAMALRLRPFGGGPSSPSNLRAAGNPNTARDLNTALCRYDDVFESRKKKKRQRLYRSRMTENERGSVLSLSAALREGKE